jgi:predicted DsbA family dithiol-disulfide isomerase
MPEQENKIQLEVFSDYVCPWCYLSTPSIEKLKAKYPVEIKWIPFPLHPDTPTEGLALADLFQGRDMTPVQTMLKKRMAEAGLEYSDRALTYNSRLAQELGKWADTQEGGEAIHEAIFRAYFVEGKNLAEIDVLLDAVSAVGLDRELAREVLESRTFSAQVDQDWVRSRAHGITGVPAFVGENQMVVGCQPYEYLEEFVQHLLQNKNKTV